MTKHHLGPSMHVVLVASLEVSVKKISKSHMLISDFELT